MVSVRKQPKQLLSHVVNQLSLILFKTWARKMAVGFFILFALTKCIDKRLFSVTFFGCVKFDRNHMETRFFDKRACYSKHEVNRYHNRLMHALDDQMKEHNILYWLQGGSLIGAVREGGRIPYDDDNDVCILSEALQQICDTNFDFQGMPFKFEVWNCKKKQGKRDTAIPVRFIDTDVGIYVDMFEMKKSIDEDNQIKYSIKPSICMWGCRSCPLVKVKEGNKLVNRRHFSIPKDWIFPLSKCMFGGKELSCPNKSKEILRHYYGNDFMTPDKYYIF